MNVSRAALVNCVTALDGCTIDQAADLLWLAGHLLDRMSERPPEQTPAEPPPEAGGDPPAATGPPDRSWPRHPSRHPGGPAHPVRASTAEVPVHLSGDAPAAGPSGTPATALPVAAGVGLHARAALRKALRPLKRRAPHPYRTVLDELSTADRSAEVDGLFPVLVPDSERWLDLALVIDTSPSMALWHRAAEDLRLLLERLGAFRDVRTWSLDGRTGDLSVYRHRDTGTPRVRHRPAELIDPRGRRLVMVYTDGVAAGWSDGTLSTVVERWAAAGPCVVVQALPFRLWERSRLGVEPVRWQKAWSGPAVLTAAVRHGYAHGAPSPGGRPVPLLELRPDWIATWSELMAGPPAGRANGARLVAPQRARQRAPAAGTGSAADLIRVFRSVASPEAVLLAGCLAATPLTLPMMRYVQSRLPDTTEENLAEVFLSGLLRRRNVAVPGEDPEYVHYDFKPEVRGLLRGMLSREELYRIQVSLGEAPPDVAAAFGGNLDYRLLVADAAGRLDLSPDSRPFAEITAANLRALGGEYAGLADRLSAAMTHDPTGRRGAALEDEPLPAFVPLLESAVERPAPPDGRETWLRRLGRLLGMAAGPRRTDTAPPREHEPFVGSCPVCGTALGVPAPREPVSGRFLTPPSLRLEVGRSTAEDNWPWRVRAIGADDVLPTVSSRPRFVENEVEHVYLLCGDGHIFPEAAAGDRRGAAHARPHADSWNMAVAVGTPAGGKTYLLLRMLFQDLDDPRYWIQDPLRRVLRYRLHPLEELPLVVRQHGYSRTRAVGEPIRPTNLDTDAKPAGILLQQLPHALEAIRELIRRTVVDGAQRAETWGTGFRQPLVLRTGDVSAPPGVDIAWTGLADLPGELFHPEAAPQSRERLRVNAYGALVWVLDPAVSVDFDGFAERGIGRDTDYAKVLDASLRPGTTGDRIRRERIQDAIGRSIAWWAARDDNGEGPRHLVAVTKCDLIHAGLNGRRLTDLGKAGAVERGVTDYLEYARRRTDLANVGDISLLETIVSWTYDQPVHRFAGKLVEHYSTPAAFWNLVHDGEYDEVSLTGTVRIPVPSIGGHLQDALAERGPTRVLARDLVMSALACGVAYGLGQDGPVRAMLRDPRRDVRLFLCSALGTLPVAHLQPVPDGARRGFLSPVAQDTYFPHVSARSAALTQLLLAVLGRTK